MCHAWSNRQVLPIGRVKTLCTPGCIPDQWWRIVSKGYSCVVFVFLVKLGSFLQGLSLREPMFQTREAPGEVNPTVFRQNWRRTSSGLVYLEYWILPRLVNWTSVSKLGNEVDCKPVVNITLFQVSNNTWWKILQVSHFNTHHFISSK